MTPPPPHPPVLVKKLTFGGHRQVCTSVDRRWSVGLCRHLWGGQSLSIMVWRGKLEGRLVVGQGHSRRQVHLDAVVDVFLFDQAGGCRYIKDRRDGGHSTG